MEWMVLMSQLVIVRIAWLFDTISVIGIRGLPFEFETTAA